MIKLEGKVFRANLVITSAVAEQEETSGPWVKDLEKCFVKLCKSLDIPIPLWLNKNTQEFARFRQTIFFEEQFTDDIKLNRFQIRLLKQ